MDIPYRYITQDVDRHGNVRLYVRRPGRRKIRLHERPGTAAFAAEYEAAMADDGAAKESARPKLARAQSWRWLCEQHFRSAEYRQLEESTQRVRRRILEATFDEPRAPGAKETFADCPIEWMTSQAVCVLRDRKSDHFDAANNRVKAIHRVFSWALVQRPPLVTSNPAIGVSKLRRGSQGHHTWTVDEVAQYMDHHKRGTMARLALALLLYTGQRRSDVPRLGRQHARDGWLRFTQFKNRKRNPVTLSIPILPELQVEIDAVSTGNLTFLVTYFGKPFSIAGFGNKFREWCDEAKLPPRCTAHGVRKAGAVCAAENGATAHQLQAIFGWRTLAEAERYTKAAEQRRLAGTAMPLLLRTERG